MRAKKASKTPEQKSPEQESFVFHESLAPSLPSRASYGAASSMAARWFVVLLWVGAAIAAGVAIGLLIQSARQTSALETDPATPVADVSLRVLPIASAPSQSFKSQAASLQSAQGTSSLEPGITRLAVVQGTIGTAAVLR